MKTQNEQILSILISIVVCAITILLVIALPKSKSTVSIEKEKTQLTVCSTEEIQRGNVMVYYAIASNKAYIEVPEEVYKELRTGSKIDVYKIKTHNMGDTDKIYYEYIGE